MASHHITWATKEPEHGHVTKIGGPSGSWTPEEVRSASATGEVFYTKGTLTGKIALIEVYASPTGEDLLRAAAYAVADNSLDSLPDGP